MNPTNGVDVDVGVNAGGGEVTQDQLTSRGGWMGGGLKDFASSGYTAVRWSTIQVGVQGV